MRLRYLLLFPLLAGVALGQVHPLTINTNGALVASQTNFFVANSNLLQAAIGTIDFGGALAAKASATNGAVVQLTGSLTNVTLNGVNLQGALNARLSATNTATDSAVGVVKTDSTDADPVVYLASSVDGLVTTAAAASHTYTDQRAPILASTLIALLATSSPPAVTLAVILSDTDTAGANGFWWYDPSETAADNNANIRRPDDRGVETLGRWKKIQ